MKNSTAPLLIVLVVVALGVGGLLAWFTMPEPTEVEVPEREQTAARDAADFVLQPPVASDVPIPKGQREVRNYLVDRYGERGQDVLNAPSQDYTEGRPIYHSTKVYASVDRNGDPIFTKMIWSPMPPRRLEMLPNKATGGATANPTQVGPHMEARLDDPNIQKILAQSKAMTSASVSAMKWLGSQGASGASTDDVKIKKVDTGLEDVFDKLGKPAAQGGKKNGK